MTRAGYAEELRDVLMQQKAVNGQEVLGFLKIEAPSPRPYVLGAKGKKTTIQSMSRLSASYHISDIMALDERVDRLSTKVHKLSYLRSQAGETAFDLWTRHQGTLLINPGSTQPLHVPCIDVSGRSFCPLPL